MIKIYSADSETKSKEEMIMKIQFESGVSRHGDYSVNYLITEPESDPVLYAEIAVPADASEDYGYFDLKDDILRQAKEAGISEEQLSFWYDGQEDILAPDAKTDHEVKGW